MTKKAIITTHDGREATIVTKASNVLFEDGQTAQDILNDRQDTMITPIIATSTSISKVGQGDSVDYSENVVDGAYESCVLKGNTKVNLIQESSSQDVVLPYEFEDGQYVMINDTKESGALGVELKGQTLVNLAKKSTYKFSHHQDEASKYTFTSELNRVSITINEATTQWRYSLLGLHLNMLKPNTKYFVKFEGDFRGNVTIKAGDSSGALTNTATIGSNNYVIITTNDLSGSVGSQGLYFYPAPPNQYPHTYTLANVVLTEYQEGMENWDIPYFEGMQSVQAPSVTTVGKNLYYGTHSTSSEFNGMSVVAKNGESFISGTCTKNDTDYYFVSPDQNAHVYKLINNLPRNGARLTLSNTLNKANYFRIGKRDGTVSYSHSVVMDNTVKDLQCFVRFMQGDTYQDVNMGIMIEYTVDTNATTYESHKSNTLSISNEVVLRSLPNGVCDTLNVETGEYVQRIGEVVVDGSETWYASSYISSDCYCGFARVKDSINTFSANINCDKLPVRDDILSTSANFEGCVFNEWSAGDRANIIVKVAKSKLSSISEVGLKNYFIQNPITVQYELATPITSTVSLTFTNQDNQPTTKLSTYNTTTHINASSKEGSLIPILSHVNPSYPVILKPSTKYSIVANSYSNDHTNSTINFNLGGATVSTTVGNRVTTITTPSTLTSEELVMSGRGNKLNNVMVIEGDVVGDELYFEGICDCKSPILLNVGKNLFDKTKVKREKYQNYNLANGTFFISSNPNYKVTDYIRVKPNTSYTSRNLGDGAYYTFDKKPITDIICRAANFTVPSNAHYVVLNMSIGQDEDTVGLQEVPSSSLHESYKSNITTFDQKDDKTIVLRSLPNGVCDTLNVETGEYVQRIAQYTLTGNETNAWNISNNSSGELAYVTVANIIPEVKGTEGLIGNLISDTFHNDNPYHVIRHERCIGAYQTHIRIKIPEIELSVNSYKDYFRNNPTTIQYELATPVVTTIDVQGFPYAYTSGHVQLSSGSIEQSLTPKVEYSVATNRNGQIRSNQKMVERHQKQLDQLQAIILANLVNSQYNQTLTTLKYELSRV